METIINSRVHKQSVYLVLNERNKIEVVQYRPTQDKDQGMHPSDRDSYSNALGLYFDNPSHDLWMGEVACHRVVGASWGLHEIKGLNCKIIAKQQFNWDMEKPIGQRKSDEVKTSNWDKLIAEYRKQVKK